MVSPTASAPYIPHGINDITGVVSGARVLIDGHAFFVARANVEITGRAVCGQRGGAVGVTEQATEIELRLVHADWSCCPAVQGANRLHENSDVHFCLTLMRDELRALHRETDAVVFEKLTEAESELVDAALQKAIRDTLPQATKRAEQRLAAEQ